MIGTMISAIYNHQFQNKQNFTDSIYIADYTEQTKTLLIKRSVEFFSPNSPLDIKYFSILNHSKLSIDGIKFDNNSFVRNGKTLSQCEAVFFPSVSTVNSWVLFCELKYSGNAYFNNTNLPKALKQLIRTRYYYIQSGIITKTNICYLIGSLPKQSEPFKNFSISPNKLANLKRKRNIILRFQNSVEIIDAVTINV